ncbi:serine/threonine protein kinase [bacterium]|nr:serine/threonine protein kinase [bacterium]MBP9809860.1 serine/threonine protein kinase [bacterium]
MDIEIDPQAETVIFRSEGKAEHHYRRGDIIGESYQLIDLIGQGGMGVVYRVKHLILGKQYALKLLAPNHINSQSWRRFELEGRSLAKLNHANIVSIHNMGIDKACPYFIMDLLQGMSLADRIKSSGPLSEKESLEIYMQVCAGISCAHKSGIIHRDIKPGNIMLVPAASGVLVKIVDFGMARLQVPSGSTSQALTASGEIFGSPYYMSPEQTLGEEMDARSDIYSLGCSLFESLTGQVPFAGTTAIQTLMMHQEDLPPVPSSLHSIGKISPAMDAVVARCLKKEAKQRYQSADQLAIDLQRIIDGKPIGSPSLDLGSRRLTALSTYAEGIEDRAGGRAGSEGEAAVKNHRKDTVKEQAMSGFLSQLRQPKLALSLIAITALILIVGLAAIVVISGSPEKTKEQIIRKHTVQEPLALDDALTDQIPEKVKRGNARFGGLVRKTIHDLKVEDEQHKAAETNNAVDNPLLQPDRSLVLTKPAQLKELYDAPDISAGVRTINGRSMRCFNFPTTVRIGRIHTNDSNDQDARGRVIFPAEENIDLHLDSIVDDCPSLVDKLKADDIFSLRLDSLEKAGEVTKRLSKWTNLHSLTIDGGQITDAELETLDQLKTLKHLWLKKLSFDWKLFVRLKVLKQLDTLEIEDYTQFNELLLNLPTMPKLELLRLEGDGKNWLTEKSIASLARQPKLKAIKLKNKDLNEKIDALRGTKSKLGSSPDELPIYDWRKGFAKLKRVESITFEEPKWSKKQIAEFLRTVPAARVNKWATKQNGY